MPIVRFWKTIAAAGLLVLIPAVSIWGQDAIHGSPIETKEDARASRWKLLARTDLKVEKVPLKDVVRMLSELHDIPIRLDEGALTNAGLDLDIPVTASIENFTLQAALWQVLNQSHLEFAVSDGALVITSSLPKVEQPTEQTKLDAREQIGGVLGRPVHRGAIDTAANVKLSDELHRLFMMPVLEKYQKAHKVEITPTEEEIVATTAFLDKKYRERMREGEFKPLQQLKNIEGKLRDIGLTKVQQRTLEVKRIGIRLRLKPPVRSAALFLLENWKFQKHLYDRYGGGRILWQQFGPEAFDAYRVWLEEREMQGDFKITDPELRSAFYAYWTTMDHGIFLIDDEEGIRTEFLEPKWLAKVPPND